MTSQLATCHPTNRVNEVPMVQVFEPILVGIVGVGTMIKVVSQRVFNPIFIMSIPGRRSNTCYNEPGRTYTILLLVEHERSNGPTSIGAGPSLPTNADSSMAYAEVVGGSRDGAEGGRHLIRVVM